MVPLWWKWAVHHWRWVRMRFCLYFCSCIKWWSRWTTERRTVVFCTAEKLAKLVASTDQCTCISQEKYTIIGHENGALKVWKKIDENYKMLIHFQTAEGLCWWLWQGNHSTFRYCRGTNDLETQCPTVNRRSDMLHIVCTLKFVPNGLIAGSSDGRVYLYKRDGGLQRQFNDHY